MSQSKRTKPRTKTKPPNRDIENKEEEVETVEIEEEKEESEDSEGVPPLLFIIIF